MVGNDHRFFASGGIGVFELDAPVLSLSLPEEI